MIISKIGIPMPRTSRNHDPMDGPHSVDARNFYLSFRSERMYGLTFFCLPA